MMEVIMLLVGVLMGCYLKHSDLKFEVQALRERRDELINRNNIEMQRRRDAEASAVVWEMRCHFIERARDSDSQASGNMPGLPAEIARLTRP